MSTPFERPRLARRLWPVLCLVSLLTLNATQAAAGPTVYLVDRTDDGTVGNCDEFVPMDCHLRRAAFLAAIDGTDSQVLVPDGHYFLTIAGSDEDLSMTGDLDVYFTDSIEAVEGANPIIEQQAGDRVIQVHEVDDEPMNVVLRGLTLRGGDTVNIGGGVLLQVTPPATPIRSRDPSSARGALPKLALIDVVIETNEAENGGGLGLIYSGDDPGVVSLLRVHLRDNQATTGSGGGLFVLSSDAIDLHMAESIFEFNYAFESGGGLWLNADDFEIEDSVVRHNVATGGDWNRGGGIFTGSSGAIRRSAIVGNFAGDVAASRAYGGGIAFNVHHEDGPANLILENVTASGNDIQASILERGSQISVVGAAVAKARHLTVAVGSGPWGSPSTLPSVSISRDSGLQTTASLYGGGCHLTIGGTVQSFGANIERPLAGTATTCDLNVGGGDLVVADLLLKPLAVYGGPAGVPSHATTPTSPATLFAPSTVCLTLDARSAPRELLFCDAGAHESSGAAPGPWLFADGFESGNTEAWSSTVP